MLRQIPQPQLPINHYFLPTPNQPAQIPWLNKTISQPYIVRYPDQPPTRGIFYSVPLTVGAITSLIQTISQPVFSLPTPQQPPARDKFYSVPLTIGALPSLTNTISQPYIILYPQQPPVRDKFYAVPLTQGVVSSLVATINQPYIIRYPDQPKVRDIFYSVPLTTGAISSLTSTISQPIPFYIRYPIQPVIPFLQNNQLVQIISSATIGQPIGTISTLIPRVRDVFYRVPLTQGVIGSLSNTISQPTYSRYPLQPSFAYLKTDIIPAAYSPAFLTNTISQPYFRKHNLNNYSLLPFILNQTSTSVILTRLLLGVGI